MKYLVLILFTCLSIGVISAQQTQLDSLDRLLSSSIQEDTSRVDLLIALAKASFGRDFGKSKQYADDALSLASRLGYSEGIAMGSLTAGRACVYLSKVEEGQQYLATAERIFLTLEDTSRLADLTRFKGIFELNSANYDVAIALFEKSTALFGQVDDKAGQAMSIMDIGIAYLYLSTNEKALEYYLEALVLAEAGDDKYAIGNVKNSIGQIYYDQGKYAECQQMMEQSLMLAEQINDLILISDCNYYLSRIALADGQFQNALGLINKSYTIDSLQKNFRGRIHKDLLFGDIFIEQEDFAKVDYHYHRAFRLCDSIPNKEQTESFVLVKLGLMYRLQGKFQQSIKALDQVVNLATNEQLLDVLYDAYYNLALTYEAQGNTSQAYKYHKLYVQVKESVINDRREENFNKLQALYEDEQKRAEIERLNNESIIQKQEIALQKVNAAQEQQRTLLLIVFIVGLAVVVTILWVLFRNKARSNIVLTEQKDKIEKQNQQKEILLKEIHHRVKNNLQIISSLLNLQSNSISDKGALAAVKEGQNRVKSIALIHQKLYQHEDIARVDFDEYISELVAYLRSSFTGAGKAVEINIEANAINLDIDTAVPFGLIINELVSNCFKYAFPENENGRIDISLDYEDNRKEKLHLTVHDNGIGLPSNIDLTQLNSLGLKLVNMLCVQLGGEMKYSNGQGSLFDILVANTDFRKQIE